MDDDRADFQQDQGARSADWSGAYAKSEVTTHPLLGSQQPAALQVLGSGHLAHRDSLLGGATQAPSGSPRCPPARTSSRQGRCRPGSWCQCQVRVRARASPAVRGTGGRMPLHPVLPPPHTHTAAAVQPPPSCAPASHTRAAKSANKTRSCRRFHRRRWLVDRRPHLPPGSLDLLCRFVHIACADRHLHHTPPPGGRGLGGPHQPPRPPQRKH